MVCSLLIGVCCVRVCCRLFVTRCLLLCGVCSTRCCCLLFDVRCVLFVVCSALFVSVCACVFRLLFVDRCYVV